MRDQVEEKYKESVRRVIQEIRLESDTRRAE